jgi:hypothetical protein
VEEKRRAVTLAREAAFRWTGAEMDFSYKMYLFYADNYSVTVSHFCKQYDIDSDDMRKHFNLDESFEDIC